MWPVGPSMRRTPTISAYSTTTAMPTTRTRTIPGAWRPDFTTPRGERVKCSRERTGPFVKGEILPGRKARNRPLWPRHGRCLHGGVLCYPRFMCRGHAV
nr:MAG TPA: hypothetical protein [Caudoviricetes sp.]